ncbi:hypothetical protein [Pyxidicoccus parkwayensis]|nr:hypothetical protein [Pyxidicoccus parkwaysis]
MASPNGPVPAPRPAPATQGGAGSGASSTPNPGAGRSPMMSTQIFGSGPHQKPQVDGAASTPVPDTTQTFGAVPPPPSIPPVGGARTFGAGPGNATQAFGAVPAQGGSAPGNATQTFGAVSAPGNATQPFGALQAQSGRSPGNATQTFGAVSAHGSAVGNATQTFGAVPAQSGIAPGNATQTFGAVSAHGPAVGNATQTFGAVSAHGSAVGNATQTFGAVSAQSSAAPGNATQTFGAVPAHDTSAPLGRSQTFSAVSSHEASVGTARGTGIAPESAAPTQSASGIFPARGSQSPIGKTQAYGAVPSLPPEDPRDSVSPTQAYGAVSSEPAVLDDSARRAILFGATPPALMEVDDVRLPPEPVGSETLLPFGPSAQGPVAVEPAPSPGNTPRRAQVELPPELLAASRASSSSSGASFNASPTSTGRERLWLILVVVAGLILAAVLAYPAWKNRETDMPASAVEDKARATVLLRRDDTAAREQAIQRLQALTATYPKYIEAQAELAVALSLRLSDLQAEMEIFQSRADKLNREKAETRDLIDEEERLQRVAALDKDMAEVSAALAPIREEADKLRKDLYAQLAALAQAPEVEPAPAVVARLKARAVHAGVTVASDALMLAERLRNVEGSPKTWSSLARAEYALSSGSPPDSLLEVSKELEALRQEDQTLSRAYVLGARLAIRLDDPAAARSLLDDVIALNPNHQLAKRLLEQLKTNAEKP